VKLVEEHARKLQLSSLQSQSAMGVIAKRIENACFLGGLDLTRGPMRRLSRHLSRSHGCWYSVGVLLRTESCCAHRCCLTWSSHSFTSPGTHRPHERRAEFRDRPERVAAVRRRRVLRHVPLAEAAQRTTLGEVQCDGSRIATRQPDDWFSSHGGVELLPEFCRKYVVQDWILG